MRALVLVIAFLIGLASPALAAAQSVIRAQEAWEALYTLEQQPDGNFKITGCSLLKAGQAV